VAQPLATTKNPPKLFVYGTLKRFERNHQALQGVQLQHCLPGYVRGLRLYHLQPKQVRGDAWAYPALRCQPGHEPGGWGALALGECYNLDPARLEDQLLVFDHLEIEGYEYRRVLWWAIVRGKRLRIVLYLHVSALHGWRAGIRRYWAVSWSEARYARPFAALPKAQGK
jgi:gamma-glutamylcyclotransferase (GGCT)/AIG2-like uncharacterized protein YtfP